MLLVSFNAWADIPRMKEGISDGILTSKGKAWLEMKDDDGFVYRYLPPWLGDGPSKGGGFEPSVLESINEIVVGNRVRIHWIWDGHFRVNKVNTLTPEEREGIFLGKMIEVGNHWVEVENPDERKPWRFYLRWIGGYPENGGGYDGKSREELLAKSDQPLIRFRWTYDVRPRFQELLSLDDQLEKMFYEGKEPIVQPKIQTDSPVVVPLLENPFDSAPAKKNPFDSAPAKKNPFDSVPAKKNPFDSVPVQ